MKKIRVGLVGSTERTQICGQALQQSQLTEVCWLLSPAPKPVGREQIVQANPVHRWANENDVPTVSVTEKIDQSLLQQLHAIQTDRPDFLLVVDFGYLVPDWLLKLPRFLPLNIHPSALPEWRGSSPGQFVLLFGEEESAVSLIAMSENFDQGPILAQLPFQVDKTWTQSEYYQHAFNLMANQLPKILVDIAQKKITATHQPTASPTPIARKLTKDDAFIPWPILEKAMATQNPSSVEFDQLAQQLPKLLQTALAAQIQSNHPLAKLVEAAIRAFQPWPEAWTMLPTTKGEVRTKLLKASIGAQGELRLEKIQKAGQTAKNWQPEN